jgi:hypothetical protein
MTEPLDDDEFTELSGAVIPRLDLVKSGANGMPFLIAKGTAAGGVLSADQVRDLIGRDEPAAKAEQVTLSGSAAAIAAMIHQAPVRKSPAGTTEQEGAAMGDDVTKADVPDGDEPLATADETATEAKVTLDGDPDDPASPAWEAVDAARAQQAIELAIALKRLVQQADQREGIETMANGGDAESVENMWALDDVLCAIDCIIGVLAPFAVTEQAEAEERQADLEGLMKGEVRVAKAGRVLSSQNEQKIAAAVESLQSVLASLPAPVKDDGAAPVAKSEEPAMDTTETPDQAMTADAAAEAAPVEKVADEPAAEVETPEGDDVEKTSVIADAAMAILRQAAEGAVAKAKGDPQVAVYTADGKLVGTVDQSNLVPIAAPEAPEGGDVQSADEPAAEPADEPAAPADPADGATIPGTETIASPAPAEEDDAVTKAVQAGLGTLLADALAPIAEELGKHAGLGDVVKGMQEQIAELAKMPDDRKSPRLNGATGAAGLAPRDGSTVDTLADLKKAADEETDPVKKAKAQNALTFAAIKDRFADR